MSRANKRTENICSALRRHALKQRPTATGHTTRYYRIIFVPAREGKNVLFLPSACLEPRNEPPLTPGLAGLHCLHLSPPPGSEAARQPLPLQPRQLWHLLALGFVTAPAETQETQRHGGPGDQHPLPVVWKLLSMSFAFRTIKAEPLAVWLGSRFSTLDERTALRDTRRAARVRHVKRWQLCQQNQPT